MATLTTSNDSIWCDETSTPSDVIVGLDKVFGIGDDWGIYVPEVKYLAPEPLVNYEDLSLTIDDKVHFVGDALSARGISVSGAHGIYVAQNILKLWV